MTKDKAQRRRWTFYEAVKIVILHQLVKKADKTPPRELAVARRRMKEVKDAHAQRT